MDFTKEEAEALAKEKMDIQQEVRGNLEQIDAMRMELANFRQRTLSKITGEVTSDGKSLFSNETARKAELSLREQMSEFGKHETLIQEISHDVEKSRVQLQYASDKLLINITYARLAK